MASTTHSNRLEDQAASTALNSRKEQRRPSVLDEDGKLSSASAALSLKYAQAQDLPSFPSAGLKLSSAGAAASIADSNKKQFEHWKPGAIPAANKAALLAKDYEMDPLWQPELSTAGSKAALLAHRDTPNVEIWKAQGTEHGHSAAGQALKTKPPNAITERDVPPEGRQKALMAAAGAMSANRPRSGSSPVTKGDSSNWALKAATSSQKSVPNGGPFTTGDPGFEAARVQNMAKNNVNRQLYGSTPPVSIEVEEKNRQDMLRASAVAMAKKMYAIQQTHLDEAAGTSRNDGRAAARSSHQRNLSESSSVAGDDLAGARGPRYENLEEAARKLAQERLAKLHDEHAEYRQYYGAGSTNPRSRLSTRFRRRNSTGSREDSSDDEEQSRRIKKQMSLFQSNLAAVDDKKRQADRDALLVAAHRNVEAKMAQMDDKIFQETGKASPAQQALWERQAREKAQLASDERMQNVGKVHIGGGKYLDQSEVDAIAKARLQPTLDEISATAEKQRARDEEIRLENQRVQEQLAKDKAREAEVQAELKKVQAAEKAEAKAKKAEEKQALKEQAAAEKEQRKAEEVAEKERLRKVKEERQAAENAEREKATREKERAKIDAATEKEKLRVEKEKKQAEANEEKEKAVREKERAKVDAAAEKEKLRLEKEEKQAEAAAEKEKALREKERAKIDAAAEKERLRLETEEKRKSAEIEPGRVNSVSKRKDKDTSMEEAEPAAFAATASIVAAAEGDTFHDQVTVPGEMKLDTNKTLGSPYEETTPAVVRTNDTVTSPSKRESKVKSWFKSHLKSGNKITKEEPEGTKTPVGKEDADRTRDESIRDVAMAGRETGDLYGTESREQRPVSPMRETEARRTPGSSSISSESLHEVAVANARPLSGTAHTAQVGRTGMKPKLMKKVKTGKDDAGDPNRESFVTATSDDDEYEEAKDKIADDKLPLPSTLAHTIRPASPKSSHDHSKFKEEL